MSDVVQDPIVVDVPSGGIDYPADMVVTTSGAPVAAKVEEKPAAKVEEKAADPEFSTRRQEAIQGLTEFAQSFPAAVPVRIP